MTEARQLMQRKQNDEGSVGIQVTDSNLASAHQTFSKPKARQWKIHYEDEFGEEHKNYLIPPSHSKHAWLLQLIHCPQCHSTRLPGREQSHSQENHQIPSPAKPPVKREVPLLCILPAACFSLLPSSEDQPEEKPIRCEVYIPKELATSSLCLVLTGGRVWRS